MIEKNYNRRLQLPFSAAYAYILLSTTIYFILRSYVATYIMYFVYMLLYMYITIKHMYIIISIIMLYNYSSTGQPQNITVSIRPANKFPLDIYFLMDKSYSMRDDLENLKKLASQLGMSTYQEA